jgi:hypothetical protein
MPPWLGSSQALVEQMTDAMAHGMASIADEAVGYALGETTEQQTSSSPTYELYVSHSVAMNVDRRGQRGRDCSSEIVVGSRMNER